MRRRHIIPLGIVLRLSLDGKITFEVRRLGLKTQPLGFGAMSIFR
jgi:hypothetical protein